MTTTQTDSVVIKEAYYSWYQDFQFVIFFPQAILRFKKSAQEYLYFLMLYLNVWLMQVDPKASFYNLVTLNDSGCIALDRVIFEKGLPDRIFPHYQ